MKKVDIGHCYMITYRNTYQAFKYSVFIQQQELGIDYDYLVICTGSSYADPWKTQNEGCIIDAGTRLNFLSEQRDKYKQAKNILCIGGGPVGVEIATEISYRTPEKHITLVDSHKTVLSNAPKNLGEHAQRIINSRKSITSILNQRISKKEEDQSGINSKKSSMIYKTDQTNTEIKSDLVYNCIGVKPNSSFLEENHAEWLNEKKQIKVDSILRVANNIFAIGDVNSVNEAKMFYTAHMQAISFVHNMIRIIKNENLIPYHLSKENMIVSMGPHYGIGIISGIKLTGWPLGLNKGSQIASFSKYAIERITMNDFNLKLTVNELLYLISR